MTGQWEWELPWRAVTENEARSLAAELRSELHDGHPLLSKPWKVRGRRLDQDDVLVGCEDGSVA